MLFWFQSAQEMAEAPIQPEWAPDQNHYGHEPDCHVSI